MTKEQQCTCDNNDGQDVHSSELQEEEDSGTNIIIESSKLQSPDEQLSAWQDPKYNVKETAAESPFKRLQAPTPHTVTSPTPALQEDSEKLKIKQIVKEVLKAQNQQLAQASGAELGLFTTQAKLGGATNKHKMKLTNLITPQARTGTFTQLNSIQASSTTR